MQKAITNLLTNIY